MATIPDATLAAIIKRLRGTRVPNDCNEIANELYQLSVGQVPAPPT